MMRSERSEVRGDPQLPVTAVNTGQCLGQVVLLDRNPPQASSLRLPAGALPQAQPCCCLSAPLHQACSRIAEATAFPELNQENGCFLHRPCAPTATHMHAELSPRCRAEALQVTHGPRPPAPGPRQLPEALPRPARWSPPHCPPERPSLPVLWTPAELLLHCRIPGALLTCCTRGRGACVQAARSVCHGAALSPCVPCRALLIMWSSVPPGLWPLEVEDPRCSSVSTV